MLIFAAFVKADKHTVHVCVCVCVSVCVFFSLNRVWPLHAALAREEILNIQACCVKLPLLNYGQVVAA